ncbi:hypothetical protein [Neorhizobium galegae]|uniref:hypothetical protein n=1 Tax=Neorhizobium galegae TaxID=399 RepID=UPI0012D572B3|nr:hypothetical protein [Neorhizobium galegae]KAB1122056.1 hypothetical protein F4V90_22970 [Neorhizobium galegae]
MAVMIEAGSNVQAIGTTGYVVAEPVDPTDREAYGRIALVSSAFGERDHLKDEIIAYLHELGRVVEIPQASDTGLE